MKLLQIPDAADMLGRVTGFQDDFHGFLTASSAPLYTVVTAVDGTVLLSDAAGGKVAIKSAVASASGNEDTYLVREPEAFLFAANKPLQFEAMVQSTEDDVNQNNLFVGLTDAAAANLLVDNGAGPKTSGTTLCFFKKDGGLNWWVHCSLSTTQTSVELTAANSLDKIAHESGGATYQKLRIEFYPYSSTAADVSFYINDIHVYKISGYVFTSATEVQAVCGTKDGDAGDETTINLDYWYCYQTR